MNKKIKIPLSYRFPIKLDLLLGSLILIFILVFIIIAKWPNGESTVTECTVTNITSSHGYGDSGLTVICLLPDGNKATVGLHKNVPAVKGQKINLIKQQRFLFSDAYIYQIDNKIK